MVKVLKSLTYRKSLIHVHSPRNTLPLCPEVEMEASQEVKTTFFLSERRDLLKDGIQTMVLMGIKLFFYLKVSCTDFSEALSLSCDSPLTGIL